MVLWILRCDGSGCCIDVRLTVGDDGAMSGSSSREVLEEG